LLKLGLLLFLCVRVAVCCVVLPALFLLMMLMLLFWFCCCFGVDLIDIFDAIVLLLDQWFLFSRLFGSIVCLFVVRVVELLQITGNRFVLFRVFCDDCANE